MLLCLIRLTSNNTIFMICTLKHSLIFFNTSCQRYEVIKIKIDIMQSKRKRFTLTNSLVHIILLASKYLTFKALRLIYQCYELPFYDKELTNRAKVKIKIFIPTMILIKFNNAHCLIRFRERTATIYHTS